MTDPGSAQAVGSGLVLFLALSALGTLTGLGTLRLCGKPEELDLRVLAAPAAATITWGLTGGQIFHGDPSLDQSWIARPLLGWSRYATPVDGLYLASAGAHPGGGLTGLPGWLAAQTLREDLRKK